MAAGLHSERNDRKITLVAALRGSPQLSEYSQAFTEYAGRGSQRPPYALKKYYYHYDALHFHTKPLKINIFKLRFYEGEREVHKKQYFVYAFDNVDNSGRPLSKKKL